MIKRYTTPEAYAAAGLPTDESRVAEIEQTSEIKVDGVNVVVPVPGDGDAVFEDADGNTKFVRYNTIQKSLLDPSWTHVGYAFGLRGRQYRVLDKNENTVGLKFLNCWQFSITAISATTIKFWLKMKGDYATFVPVEVELSSAEINATSAAEITAALEATGNAGNTGYANHGYWAFLANANDEPVSENGTKIIVQCDFCADYRQYQCSDGSHALVGCTMALTVWGDMPASSALWRSTGCSTYWGIMNVENGESYYSTNGKTPTADWALNAVDLVTKAAFESSPYCAALRAEYGDYHNYITRNKVMYPHPDYGVFALLDAKEMTRRYGNRKFTKKDGAEDFMFPAIHYGLTVGYGNGKFSVGEWWLEDIPEGQEFMSEEVFAKMREAQTRMNTTLLVNNANRWFCRRYNANYAWFYYGHTGILGNSYVSYAFRCRAVTLCEL